jgi:hypothetical protein
MSVSLLHVPQRQQRVILQNSMNMTKFYGIGHSKRGDTWMRWVWQLRGNRRMEGVTQLLKGRCRSEFNTAFDQPTELTPPPIRMDWSFSLKDEI